MSGWIRLHRQIQDSKVWNSEPFSCGQAWVDLLLMANHKPGTFRVRGVFVTVERGQVGVSEVSLAEKWKWSRGKLRRFLNWLENERQIVQQKSNVTSLITIVKYDEYQCDGTANGTANGTADGQQTDSRRYTNKKKEECKQGEEGKERQCRFVKPTVSEVAEYCKLRNNSVDAESFVAYYESNGWKVGRNPMKSWQGAVRTWEKNNNGRGRERTLFEKPERTIQQIIEDARKRDEQERVH